MKGNVNISDKDINKEIGSDYEGLNVIAEEKAGGERIRYRLVSSEKDIDGVNTVVYGIHILSTLFGNPEEAIVKDITSDIDFAKDIFRIVSDNLVLPVSLVEIVEDYINAKYS